MSGFDTNVFINCPLYEEYAPLLQVMLFCVVLAGLSPRIATESGDSGENRLEKIRGLIEESRWSIHDLSRCQARTAGEFYRMNMPFELGIDWGCRQYFGHGREKKRFLILEEKPYRFQAALSDISGCDIEVHGGMPQKVVVRVRNWLHQQTGALVMGPTGVLAAYDDFQAWDFDEKLRSGFSNPKPPSAFHSL